MTQGGPDGPRKHAPRTTEIHQTAWEHTLEDMEALASELREEGLDVLTLQAGDTAPEVADAGGERFGLSYVIPGNRAEGFREAFSAIGTPRYRVFRTEVGGNVFIVTQISDQEAGQAILVAGVYQKQFERELVQAASEAGVMYTHVQTLDGTHLGTFEHEDWTLFFPEADAS